MHNRPIKQFYCLRDRLCVINDEKEDDTTDMNRI